MRAVERGQVLEDSHMTASLEKTNLIMACILLTEIDPALVQPLSECSRVALLEIIC